MKKIRTAIVNYLNTKPFIYGLKHSDLRDQLELIECSPADCADNFFQKKAAISLVPVGSLIDTDYKLVSRYGIASDGEVSSVCLFSSVPLHEIRSVFLDYQSRTSVLLVQLLFKHYWSQTVEFIESYPGYEYKIEGTTAGLIIGDRCINLKNRFPYVYDLGAAWKLFSGLPFVFALWLSHENVPESFLDKFNKSIGYGVDSIGQMLIEEGIEDNPVIKEYFQKNIQYTITELHLQGLHYFIALSKALVSVEMEK